MTGIYKITNSKDRVYIGQSLDILNRFKIYRNLRCKGQIKLYSSFLKYGVENHSFEILCECEINELNKKERYYQDLYSVLKTGLNLKLTETTEMKCKVSTETKQKISVSNRIAFAKKRGDYDVNYDYSIKKEKCKKITFENCVIYKDSEIYFTETEEYFKKLTHLYNKYPNLFLSYSNLCIQFKKQVYPKIETGKSYTFKQINFTK